MTKRKWAKPPKINMQLCPICGGRWRRLSGFLVCRACGHRDGSWEALIGDGRPRDGAIGPGHVLACPTEADFGDYSGRNGEVRYDHGLKWGKNV
jgi:hypothetical protein